MTTLAQKERRLEARGFEPMECVQCRDCLDSQPHLVGACASVGIEHGMTTDQMLYQYLLGYHARGHTERG